ncbi:hypothetical protein FXO38_29231 [Capsicum annuum]|nr:hypothetical protein FXO38_29231 [Capsicum annuum]KAF3627947.1 hypothetical protein FXO37_29615 [Capsicum annuum]
MDSRPSFSLGLTQIQSTYNEIDIFGFVPCNFDYKDVGFRENRSKYQNNLTIMKKLRDAASVKRKKTVVDISKEKGKKVVKRDPLPKGMKYVIKTVSHHPLRFGISFNLDKDIACRIGNRIPRICNWFVVGTNPKFEKFMNGMFSKYVYTNISPTVDELKCIQLPNHDGMDLKDCVSSTLPSTFCKQPIKVDQKAKIIASSLLLDDFDDFTTPPPLGLLTRSKAKSDISLGPPSKRRKTDAEQKESVTDQEKIKGSPSVKEVNESPSSTSNTITDPNNEEAPHEPSLMDFGEQTPPAEQNPPIVKSGRESTKKINVSGGTYHEQVLIKVDMNAIESLVKTYVDKRFNNIEVLMKKYHGEMEKQHEEMMLAVKEKHDAPQKESETEVKNDVFQHSIDNTIADFSSPVSCTVISSKEFQEFIDNIIAGMSTPIIAMESTNDSSTDASQESIDNIIAGISTPVVAMKIKFDAIKTCAPRNRKRTTIFTSPFTTAFGSSCKGKESATVDFPRKHPFDGYLISYDMPTGLIEEYCDWIVYDSILSSQHREPSHEIKRLSVMLPTYISYSGLLENTERTVWSSLEAYTDKMSKVAGDLNDTPFDVEYIEDIA